MISRARCFNCLRWVEQPLAASTFRRCAPPGRLAGPAARTKCRPHQGFLLPKGSNCELGHSLPIIEFDLQAVMEQLRTVYGCRGRASGVLSTVCNQSITDRSYLLRVYAQNIVASM